MLCRGMSYYPGYVRFEMISAQNMLMAAESSLLQAKYDFLFKQKVLDFYRGLAF